MGRTPSIRRVPRHPARPVRAACQWDARSGWRYLERHGIQVTFGRITQSRWPAAGLKHGLARLARAGGRSSESLRLPGGRPPAAQPGQPGASHGGTEAAATPGDWHWAHSRPLTDSEAGRRAACIVIRTVTGS